MREREEEERKLPFFLSDVSAHSLAEVQDFCSFVVLPFKDNKWKLDI